jgi:hypothetical protein
MKKVIASAGLLALGALGVQTTQAQLVAGAEKPWSISGTLRGFYDDNYDTQPDGPTRRGSWGYELRPSVMVNLVEGSTTLNLSYIYDYKYYIQRPNGKADQTHDVEFFLNHNFNERYSVDVSDSFVIAQEPEIIDPNLSAIDRANGDNIRNTAAINFHAQITRLLGIVVGYNNTYYNYRQDAGNLDLSQLEQNFPSYSALLNRMEQFAHFDTRWQITDTSVGVLGYSFGVVTYSSDESILALNPPVGVNQPPTPPYPYGGPDYVASDSRNNYSHTIYVGLDHSFRSDLSFSGRAGVQFVDYYQAPPGSPQSSPGPYVDLSLNYNYMDGGVVVVGFHNAYNQTDLGAGGVGSAVSVTGTGVNVTEDEESSTAYINVTQVLKPISPRLTATGSFQYQHSTFNGGSFDNESDDYFLFGFNLAYQVNHWISTEAGYNYDLLTSDVPDRGYNRNRVYIGVTATY